MPNVPNVRGGLYTQAPWRVVPIERNKKTHQGCLGIFPVDGPPISTVDGVNIRNRSAKAVADANLISAAPELLAALNRCRNALDSHALFESERRHALEQADAAISKALWPV